MSFLRRGRRGGGLILANRYLQGVAAFQAVSGIQDAGTQATIKHFIGNEQVS